MQLMIRNFRRISSADIDLTNIAFITGHNGAGKSCIAQALAAALTHEPVRPIGKVLKKDASMLVHDGAKEGNIVLTGPLGRTEVKYPGCVVGGAGYSATPLAVGAMRISDGGDAVAAYVVDALAATPSDDEVANAVEELGIDKGDVLSVLVRGWDDASSHYAKEALMEKGNWRAITAKNWGSQIAAAWLPDGITRQEDGAQLAQSVAHARVALEEAQASQAIGEHQLQETRTQAARYPEIKEKFRASKAIVTQMEAAIDALLAQEAELKVEANMPVGMKCPSCMALLNVADGKLVHATASDTPTTVKADLMRVQTALTEQRMAHRLAAIERDKLLAEGKTSKKAVDALAEMDPSAPITDIAAVRATLQQAESKMRAFDQLQRATQAHQSVTRNLSIAALLAPDGLRREALLGKLKAFNDGPLARYSEMLCLPPVRLTDDLSVAIGERPYALMSGGERFCADVVMQLAFAELDGSDCVVVDGADVLQYPRRREGLLKALKTWGGPALVTMSMKSPQAAPDLKKMGIGVTYTLVDGKAEAVPT